MNTWAIREGYLGEGIRDNDGVPEGSWVQTSPGRGWCVCLRLYSPLQPFFDKTWRPGEIEEVDQV